jgi:hypothetical protein
MPTLFQIGEDFQALDQLLDELGGDISDPTVESAIMQWQESLAADEAVKLDGYCNYVKQLDAFAATMTAEAAEYTKRAQQYTNRAKWLKARMLAYLQSQGRTKATTATGRTIAIQANGGKPPLVLADGLQVDDVPAVFTQRSIDESAIREALENGESLPFARLGDRGIHLRIR